MEIESKISVKKSNGEVVSADVMLYNDTGDVVKRITIIDSEVLQSLEDEIDSFENNYVSITNLNSTLLNTGNLTTINATRINGNDASEYAKRTDIPTSLEPTIHASNTAKYGLGDQYKFGHVKARNDLSASSFISGEALSAFQGAQLNNRLSTVETKTTALENRERMDSLYMRMCRANDRAGMNSDTLDISRGSKVLIKGFSTDDSYDWNGNRILIYINGDFYERTMKSNGECEFQINLPVGTYLMVVFKAAHESGRNDCVCMKRIEVPV